MKKFYIAYGSNLNVEQMKVRCPDSKIVGTAFIPNYQLLFRGSKTGSYLTIEPKAYCCVPVAVWEVTPTDEKNLDRYEGYPAFYYKQNFTIAVQTNSGKTVLEAFAYIMHQDRPLGEPAPWYIHTCLAGYRTFDFDTDYFAKAIQESRGAQHEV